MGNIILRIKEEMEIQKITKYRLSKITGIAESQISRWFNGDVEPSISKVEKLAEAVGLKIELVKSKQ